jgi:hypothetical protein
VPVYWLKVDPFFLEETPMPGIVDFPEVVKKGAEDFRSFFSCAPQFQHFSEYLTGLMVAHKKTVNGIVGEFSDISDQSCLNRFMTHAAWDEEALNAKRIDILQQDPSTRFHSKGVIPIDNVLIDHEGKLIKDVGWFWDHCEDRYKIAHDYLIINYVCPNGKHYPLEFHRFKKEEQCQLTGETFYNHTKLCKSLVSWAVDQHIPGTFTFDNYFTNAEVLNFINDQKDGNDETYSYVGDLKTNRKLNWHGKLISASDFAAQIDGSSRKDVNLGDGKQWYFSVTLKVPGVDHRVRIVILWDKKNDVIPRKVLITNRCSWEITRILRTYKYRWTGTETFHRDAKQELGMGECQLRSDNGQTRHMYMVMLAYTLLMRELDRDRICEWAFVKLRTIGEACRAITKEMIRKTIAWVIEQINDGEKNIPKLFSRLALT